MGYNNKRNISKPCIYFQEGVATNVNSEFLMLTGFSIRELAGKSISEIMKLLKADSQVKLIDINDVNCYIFSKECNPREVRIYCKRNSEGYDSTYCFEEIKNSRMEDNYPYLSNFLPDSV